MAWSQAGSLSGSFSSSRRRQALMNASCARILDVVGIAEKGVNGPDDTRPVLVHEPAEGILTPLAAPGDDVLV